MPTPDSAGDLENILSQVWPAPYRIQISSGLGSRPAGLTFGLLPHPGRPTLLVPTTPRRVTARALHAYKSPTTRGDRLRARVLGWAARAGAGHLFPWTVSISGPHGAPNLVAHIEDHANEALHAAIAIGPPRANRKPVLHLMTSNGTSAAFVKVGINPLTSGRVLAETRALDRLNRLAMPRLTVPAVLDIPNWRDTPFLATRPLNSWTSGVIHPETRARALRSLATAADVVTTDLQTSQWWRGLTTRLEALEDSAETSSLLRSRAVVEAQIGELRIPQGQAHGDWSPWNIAIQGAQVSAWDWERFMDLAPIGYDALHFAVQEEIRQRATPPREALMSVLERAPALVAENGADPDLGTALFAIYLLAQSEQHLTDRQLDAGSERGAISGWLIPALESVTTQLVQSAR